MLENKPGIETQKPQEAQPYKVVYHMVTAYLQGNVNEAERLAVLLEGDKELEEKLAGKSNPNTPSDPYSRHPDYREAGYNAQMAENMRKLIAAKNDGNLSEEQRLKDIMIGGLKKEVSASDIEAL